MSKLPTDPRIWASVAVAILVALGSLGAISKFASAESVQALGRTVDKLSLSYLKHVETFSGLRLQFFDIQTDIRVNQATTNGKLENIENEFKRLKERDVAAKQRDREILDLLKKKVR